MSSTEIISLIVTVIGIFSFASIFTILYGNYASMSMKEINSGKRDIEIILDGVFNHTGDDSRYFNRYGKYDSVGAYQSEDSGYHDWFCFDRFPDSYASWWGIEILPKLNPQSKACRDFLAGIGGVAETYIQKGKVSNNEQAEAYIRQNLKTNFIEIINIKKEIAFMAM